MTPTQGWDMTSPSLDTDALLRDPAIHILVCCGSGGVGKTTTAAALAVRAADLGRRVVVLTIDPARRLAQSLGLDKLDNEPKIVPGAGSGPGRPGEGRLDAMMLDMKRTFDEIVEAHADPERASTILTNPFYEALSTSFAGTQEYMAMEKLGQLHKQSASWDLIVVDTPPSRSALDFLDAPKRMGSFLDGRFMRLLVAPAKLGGRAYFRIINAGFGVFTNVLDKILGAAFLRDLQVFMATFEVVFSDWRTRADQTYALLADRQTAFLVIATPEPDALREAKFFVERLAQAKMPLAGMVLNRITTTPCPELSPEQAAAGAQRLREAGGEEAAAPPAEALTAALLDIHHDRASTAHAQAHLAQRFSGAYPEVAVALVPALTEDVHDLQGLREVGAALAGSFG
ncbi:MAG: ArsA family ATPase [Candidatus Nanopelagicales bacterium]